MKEFAEVLERAATLRKSADLFNRKRIRDIMNGGPEGVQAALTPNYGENTKKQSLGPDLPTSNLLLSGLERQAQKIGRQPTIKTDMIPIADTNTAREKAEKRARIIRAWDDTSRMELQYPQMARWLTGYGFTLHVIREQTYGDTTIPIAQLRDPYDVFPGAWGPDQQPDEVAVWRNVSRKELMRRYPHHAEKMQSTWAGSSVGGVAILGQGSGWEGQSGEPTQLVEYMCNDGCYVLCPEIGVLDFIPNPLMGGPAFVITKRFSFDKLTGQYDHVVGLMAMMAKLNILALIATEDSVFRETNIIGEMTTENYDRGRKAINLFEPGTRIEKPTSDQLQQTWQAINVMERQLRVVAGYPVADDGQSPNSFATGQGIRELGSSANQNVKEYQTAIKHSVELIDRKRLEWEEVMHPDERKKVYWYEGGNHFEETYVATKDIDKDYRTSRVYGAMATFDENSKIVAGLQLMQARVLDRRSLQEELDGFHNVSLINERIDQDMAKEALIGGLGERFGAQDAAAGMALVEIFDKPKDTAETLKKLFTPQEPEMTPEEQAMAGAGGQQMGPPPAVQTVLSQMEAAGGGVQSVGQMR